jgi:hypothetical protein
LTASAPLEGWLTFDRWSTSPGALSLPGAPDRLPASILETLK